MLSALNSGWKQLALGNDEALQLNPVYGPFAAVKDTATEYAHGLASLQFGDDGLWLLESDEVAPAPGTVVDVYARCDQMIAQHIAPVDLTVDVTPLTDDDAPDMQALAKLTKPGPFANQTHQLSPFIGIRIDGRLAAMAGERMSMDGFAEVSGVCTHPDFRGRGYAAGLMSLVARRIMERGETPFLHAYSANTQAIELYKKLGFEFRRALVLTVLKRTEAAREAGAS